LENDKRINKRKIFFAIIIIIAIIYIAYIAYLLIGDETDTCLVNQGTVYKEETVVGYILRNEVVIENQEIMGEIIPIMAEGEKVAKDNSIFQYYHGNQQELNQKINEIDLKLQEALKNEKIATTSELKLIENQIDKKIEKLKKLSNIQEISEYNKDIDKLLDRKINFIEGSIQTSTYVKELINERKKYENQLTQNAIYVKAPVSGIVSYRVDGLEGTLTINNIDNINWQMLEDMNLKTGQIVATSTKKGKIIDNFKYYIATSMDSEETENAKVGQKVKLRLSTNDEIDAKISNIKEEENKRLIIFEISKMTENLIDYRKITFDVIWSSNSGLKVPNQTIIQDEKGLNYVIRQRLGTLAKVLVKVEKTNENYSIITTYTTSELTELGYTKEEILQYKKIKLYDEIMLYPNLDLVK
jgi:putative membrane fusion protein